jgi:hypothetical protein
VPGREARQREAHRMANSNKPGSQSTAQQGLRPRPIFPMIAVAVFVAAGIAFLVYGRSGSASTGTAAANSTTQPPASSTATPVPYYGTFYPSQGHTHLDPGTPDDFVYNSNPPTSGPHREIFTDTFVSPSPLPSWVQVHLLEHGNVLLQYSCKCPEIISGLTTIAMSYDSKLIPPDHLQPTAQDVQGAEEQGTAVIVAPYPKMKSKIALTAWTRLAAMNIPDQAKIASFINSFLHNATNASQ